MKVAHLFNDIAAHRLQIGFLSRRPPAGDDFTGIGTFQSRNSPNVLWCRSKPRQWEIGNESVSYPGLYPCICTDS